MRSFRKERHLRNKHGTKKGNRVYYLTLFDYLLFFDIKGIWIQNSLQHYYNQNFSKNIKNATKEYTIMKKQEKLYVKNRTIFLDPFLACLAPVYPFDGFM